MSLNKAVITCALTGVLTDPAKHPVPVTPEEMAASARDAYNAGATVMHVHFRNQQPGLGNLPSWDPDVAEDICGAIREACPKVVLNLSTGVFGADISGPVSCFERVQPEIAALNAGSLNYLKIRRNGEWAWPPLVFDNSVEKIKSFSKAMKENRILPECECFDTGILRSVAMFVENGILPNPPHVSLVMGVASGMAAKKEWLPLLCDEMLPGTHWQTIAIGRQEIWDVHRATAELGGDLRTGVEDTFYLPNGDKTTGNGPLIEALANVAREVGRGVASPEEARKLLGFGTEPIE